MPSSPLDSLQRGDTPKVAAPDGISLSNTWTMILHPASICHPHRWHLSLFFTLLTISIVFHTPSVNRCTWVNYPYLTPCHGAENGTRSVAFAFRFPSLLSIAVWPFSVYLSWGRGIRHHSASARHQGELTSDSTSTSTLISNQPTRCHRCHQSIRLIRLHPQGILLSISKQRGSKRPRRKRKIITKQHGLGLNREHKKKC